MTWRPISSLKHRVSRDKPVLAFFPHLGVPVVAWMRSTYDYTWNRYPGPPYAWVVSHSTTYNSAVKGHPTHWMPLPASPPMHELLKPVVQRYERFATAAMEAAAGP